jgi:methionyl-tRNA formyltransferase
MSIKIVFMGSPDFATSALRALAQNYMIVGVVTQPDREAGRGKQLKAPPVKQVALELDLPVIQPDRLREPEAMAQLLAWAPDLIVVAAFGQILRQAVLEMPHFGCLNVHASLLPRWRGAAPIQACLLAGDTFSGVTIMRMDPGVDTGPVLAQRQTTLAPEDTAGTLSERLSTLGAELLIDTLPAYLAGEIIPQPQANELATYAPMLRKEAGQLDLHQPAELLARLVRAYAPWPGAYTLWQEEVFKVQRAHAAPGMPQPAHRGVVGNLPALGTACGWLVLDEVQPAGKKAMPGEVFLRGARHWMED